MYVMTWRGILRIVLVTGVLWLLALGGCAGGTAAGERSKTSFLLSVQEDTLSVQIKQVPLGEVLTELARRMPLTVSVAASVAAEEVSIVFHHLPLAQGIRRLLRDRNYLLLYAPPLSAGGSLSTSKIRELRVFAKEAGPSLRQGRTETAMTRSRSAPRLEPPMSLQEPVPPAQAAVPEALDTQVETEEALPTDVQALRDPDPQVRSAALERLKDAQGSAPLEPLIQVALTDTISELQMEVLKLLAERDEQAALDHLQQALRDPDPHVRALANELLEAVQKTAPQEQTPGNLR